MENSQETDAVEIQRESTCSYFTELAVFLFTLRRLVDTHYTAVIRIYLVPEKVDSFDLLWLIFCAVSPQIPQRRVNSKTDDSAL